MSSARAKTDRKTAFGLYLQPGAQVNVQHSTRVTQMVSAILTCGAPSEFPMLNNTEVVINKLEVSGHLGRHDLRKFAYPNSLLSGL